AGKRLWAVTARFEGGRVLHTAVAYDAVGPDAAPQREAWATDLCDAPPAAGPRTRQELLTLAGRNLVFCSNAGAVVAVDAATGQRAWGFRYTRSRKTNAGGDPSPAVAFGGRVFVAPADGEHVYALDADTGRLIWQSGRAEGVRVLGIAAGRLVVSVTDPVRGIRGLSLETGSYQEDGGWILGGGNSSGSLTLGQGIVTDGVALWPTQAGLAFIDPSSPRSSAAPNPSYKALAGNLAYADGVLVVVTPTHVRAYTPESRKLFLRPGATPRERFEWWLDRAESALAAGNRDSALADLITLAASDLPAPLRAWAAARAAQWTSAATREQLPAALKAALKPDILAEWVFDAAGLPVTLDAFLKRQFGDPR
ncbi:MAG: PQQ-binding-like beta-propeller repeat protein, partial [Gemmataceae bacterium]|nr:PQQ-binding-like beta-propeller repeat protein [Gemmataceae bacterium]